MVRFSLLPRRDTAAPSRTDRDRSPASASASASPSTSAAPASPPSLCSPHPTLSSPPSTAPGGGGKPPPSHRVSLRLGPMAATAPLERPRSPGLINGVQDDPPGLPALDVPLPQALEQLATAHAAGLLSADAYRTLRASAFARATAAEPAPPPPAPTPMIYTPPPSATQPRPPPLSRSAVHAARLENGSYRTSIRSGHYPCGSATHTEESQPPLEPVKRRSSWRKLLPSNPPKRWSSNPSNRSRLSPVPDTSPWEASAPVASPAPVEEPRSPSLMQRFRPSSRASTRALSNTHGWGSPPARASSSMRTPSRASLSSVRSSIFSSAGSAPPAPGADWGSAYTMEVKPPSLSMHQQQPTRPPSPRSAARARRLALEKHIAALSAASEALSTHFGSPATQAEDLPGDMGEAALAANEAMGRYEARIRELQSEVRTAKLRERALR